jgi:autophagy-related protein 33
LLTLPSASTASRAFKSLTSTAETHLRSLTSLSGSAFLLAYLLSPRSLRHPYLLYTSILVLGSQFATSEFVAPFLYLNPRQPQSSGSGSAGSAAAKERKERAARARMEASYEVLGATVSDAHSEGTASGEEIETEEQNGEQVRYEVEDFLKKQLVQTSVASLGFLMSVVGIWGDGAAAPDVVILA